MRKVRLSGTVLALLCGAVPTGAVPAAAQQQEQQQQPRSESLLNLAEAPRSARFPVTGRVWPGKAGEASVCLWSDDKLAAFSITIDDNSAPDVGWWLEKSKQAALPLTWFLITGRVGAADSFWGDWALWKRVRDAGHAVESHTVTHLHVEEPGWKGIEWEYADSIRQIGEGMAGHRVRFLAYPGGPNSGRNDRKIAAKQYLAARGTRGSINMAGQIDYLDVNGMSAPQLDNPDPKKGFADVRNLLAPDSRYYRGWAVLLFHLVRDKAGAQKFLDFYTANRGQLWGATFGDVALYGQERDTARIRPGENTAVRVTFTLSDGMDDARYDFPLTVKVRLPESWKNIRAAQNGEPVEAKIVEHAGGRFALVKAVPDKGLVTLTPR